ncbi:type IV toxin-antitoxin system AbiEi family antitoxin [Georgenia sp. SUBG003]|uniref:type IV toxin-antitoxin system AbiEi family antitoxin n=1 Tax=Georgenia sp. SUBG003 TaxID=1497974 RepID=UPI0006932B13
MDLLAPDQPITITAARAAGFSANDLTDLVEQGTLVRPFQGVYLSAAAAADVRERARAVGLLLPDGAALAREAAAWLHGVDVRPPDRYREAPLLECVSDSELLLNAVRRPGLRGYLADLPAGDIVTVHGVPVTSPARTALDLARYTERYMGLAALDMFSHRRLLSLDEISERIQALAGRRWIARARSVLALADPRAELPGESWTRLRIHEAGLPLPDLQIRLFDETGRENYRLDMGYHAVMVALEFDGEQHHRATTEQSCHDERRRTDIERRWGWTAYAFHAGHVLGRQPVVEATVIEALGLRMEPSRRRWDAAGSR